jgi:hypothetical protein
VIKERDSVTEWTDDDERTEGDHDDEALETFIEAMAAKLAKKREEGRGGWWRPECDPDHLRKLLREHVDKGDPVDVANIAMMLHARGERTSRGRAVEDQLRVIEQQEGG